MTTKTLLDGAGASFSADLNLTLGRQSAATTRSFNLSTEDNAALVALSNALPLPTGAATSSNQTTLTTAFGAQADVAAANGASGSAMAYLRALKDAATSPTPNLVSDANTGEYETVAASQTDQAMGATGGVGDYFSHIIIVPATTSPGAVSIKDGAGSAITIFAGGASSVTSLAPITVALDLKSLSGAWKVTTGTNVSAISVGNFT